MILIELKNEKKASGLLHQIRKQGQIIHIEIGNGFQKRQKITRTADVS